LNYIFAETCETSVVNVDVEKVRLRLCAVALEDLFGDGYCQHEYIGVGGAQRIRHILVGRECLVVNDECPIQRVLKRNVVFFAIFVGLCVIQRQSRRSQDCALADKLPHATTRGGRGKGRRHEIVVGNRRGGIDGHPLEVNGQITIGNLATAGISHFFAVSILITEKNKINVCTEIILCD